ncbi:MAG: hypothetical protein ACREX3_09590 [Gammaproteobacteria bacterium]
MAARTSNEDSLSWSPRHHCYQAFWYSLLVLLFLVNTGCGSGHTAKSPPFDSEGIGPDAGNSQSDPVSGEPAREGIQSALRLWSPEVDKTNFFSGTGEDPAKFMQDVIAHWTNKLNNVGSGASERMNTLADEVEVVTGMTFLLEDMGKMTASVTRIDIAIAYGMRVDENGIRRYSQIPSVVGHNVYNNLVLIYMDEKGNWQGFLLTPEGAGWFTANQRQMRLVAAFTDEGRGTSQIRRVQVARSSLFDDEPESMKVLPTSEGLFAFFRITKATAFDSVEQAVRTAFTEPGSDFVEPVPLSGLIQRFHHLRAQTTTTAVTQLTYEQYVALLREGRVSTATIIESRRKIEGRYDRGEYAVSVSPEQQSRVISAIEDAGVRLERR